MTHIFKIHTALFILTAMRNATTVEIDEVAGSDCRFSSNDDQPIFRINSDIENCFLVELLDKKLVALRPIKFQGKKYVFTYIPVLN